MPAANNRPWNLESFIDSLVVELDKTRETLAVKAINKPLTYSVKDIGLDLQLFPSYDGDQVRFVTAQPGEDGSSKLSIKMGSITDQQIRQTTKDPISKEDVSLEVIEDIDSETKKTLRKIGVTSVDDLQKIENKNVDLEKVSKKKVSYKKLADILKKSRRGERPPTVKRVSLGRSHDKDILTVNGENLSVDRSFEPVAVLNKHLANILSANTKEITVELGADHLKQGDNELIMTLDPYAVFKLNIQKSQENG